MKETTIAPFNMIGLSVRTQNKDGQGLKDIGALWGRIMSEGIVQKIPNKVDEQIYSLYTEYDGDHTLPYTTLIGCKVTNLDHIPDGMTGKAFDGGKYTEFVFQGDLTKGMVGTAWGEIYEADIDRVFTADFEVYGEKAQNPTDAEVSIFIAIK